MRRLLFSLCLLFVTVLVYAQSPFVGNVATYHFNGTAANGVKIKTNMPFTNGLQIQQQKEHEAVLHRLKDLEAEMKQIKAANK
ncbi:hypothetical protein [uncultured Chitinophaga sp.]|jgi:hypothetical protein|uniref:hypothetical protein n=1 Tax=uncultured Chitinophaga sp. TaxID=339340 RepID=UPI00260F3631|nr:hypothetical protein [uncultured Chitinophaga sp.]